MTDATCRHDIGEIYLLHPLPLDAYPRERGKPVSDGYDALGALVGPTNASAFPRLAPLEPLPENGAAHEDLRWEAECTQNARGITKHQISFLKDAVCVHFVFYLVYTDCNLQEAYLGKRMLRHNPCALVGSCFKSAFIRRATTHVHTPPHRPVLY